MPTSQTASFTPDASQTYDPLMKAVNLGGTCTYSHPDSKSVNFTNPTRTCTYSFTPNIVITRKGRGSYSFVPELVPTTTFHGADEGTDFELEQSRINTVFTDQIKKAAGVVSLERTFKNVSDGGKLQAALEELYDHLLSESRRMCSSSDWADWTVSGNDQSSTTGIQAVGIARPLAAHVRESK